MKTIALILALLPGVAMAAQPTHVTTMTSLPGETMDAFALRIAPEAIERSMNIAAEVCGEFKQEGDVYSIALYSIGTQHGCSYLRDGAGYTGQSYHTHIVIGETDSRRREGILGNPRFSESDYAHPGYLASGNKVLHQVGRGTERRVRQ
jgi:hypothetical protein